MSDYISPMDAKQAKSERRMADVLCQIHAALATLKTKKERRYVYTYLIEMLTSWLVGLSK